MPLPHPTIPNHKEGDRRLNFHSCVIPISANVQGLRTGPPSSFASLSSIYYFCSTAHAVEAGWVEGRLQRTEPEAQC
jgi:hypothetical protein